MAEKTPTKIDGDATHSLVSVWHDGAWLSLEDFIGYGHAELAAEFAQQVAEDAGFRQTYVEMVLD